MNPKLTKLVETVVSETLNEIRNTVSADVNEILLGYFLLPGQGWGRFHDGAIVKAHLDDRGSEMTQEDWDDQMGRAEAMADAVLDWAETNGFEGGPVKAWWTARPGILSKAVGYPVDSKTNPTDTLIQFADGQFLGLSAKSTKRGGDIAFKNPGVGTIGKALSIPFKEVYEMMMIDAIEKYNLPIKARERKAFIRADAKIKEETEAIGFKILENLRNKLLERLEGLSDEELKQHLLEHWLDAGALEPRYIKVTGHGRNGKYHATIMDPVNNPKVRALANGNLEVMPLGNTAIGVKANDQKILKMRFKWESQKLASSIKLSGDPW